MILSLFLMWRQLLYGENFHRKCLGKRDDIFIHSSLFLLVLDSLYYEYISGAPDSSSDANRSASSRISFGKSI